MAIAALELKNGRQQLMLLAAVFAAALTCLVLMTYTPASETELLSGSKLALKSWPSWGQVISDQRRIQERQLTKLDGEEEVVDVGPATPLQAGLFDVRGKNRINNYCAKIEQILDGTNLGYGEFWQKHMMARCMQQDCEMAFETQEGIYSGCRYTDEYGFCYAYISAQEFCANHPDDEHCNDNSPTAALPPLGELAGDFWENTWEPVSDVELKLPGKPGEGVTYSCSCMKNCGCVGQKDCWCLDPEAQPVGTDEGAYAETNITQYEMGRGHCACTCGGVSTGLSHHKPQTLRGHKWVK